MSTREVKSIEDWFDDRDHECDDFLRTRLTGLTVSPQVDAERVIYCTKRYTVENVFSDVDELPRVGIICRAGLPNEKEVAWLRAFVGNRSLLFLGDLDPADLMIFAWLRAQKVSKSVVHFGINDNLCAQLQYKMPDRHRISLGTYEIEAVSQIERFVPDAREILGPNSYAVWKAGSKIEIEAIFIDVSNGTDLLGMLVND